MGIELECGLHYSPAQVLRHRGTMCLIDAIGDYGHEWIEALVNVRVGKPFAEGRGVPAWVGIEYMAQAVAAWSGIEQLQAGRQPVVGLLVGTHRYECTTAWFALGATLRVRAELLLYGESDLAVFRCTIHDRDVKLAQAEIKVCRPQDVHSFLTERGQ